MRGKGWMGGIISWFDDSRDLQMVISISRGSRATSRPGLRILAMLAACSITVSTNSFVILATHSST